MVCDPTHYLRIIVSVLYYLWNAKTWEEPNKAWNILVWVNFIYFSKLLISLILWWKAPTDWKVEPLNGKSFRFNLGVIIWLIIRINDAFILTLNVSACINRRFPVKVPPIPLATFEFSKFKLSLQICLIWQILSKWQILKFIKI